MGVQRQAGSSAVLRGLCPVGHIAAITGPGGSGFQWGMYDRAPLRRLNHVARFRGGLAAASDVLSDPREERQEAGCQHRDETAGKGPGD